MAWRRLTKADPIYWHIYAAHGGNELIHDPLYVYGWLLLQLMKEDFTYNLFHGVIPCLVTYIKRVHIALNSTIILQEIYPAKYESTTIFKLNFTIEKSYLITP